MTEQQTIDLLNTNNYSCVIVNNGELRTFTQRGVADLYDLYTNDPAFLDGAFVADKVVGKGAAALMALGRVAKVHANVMSRMALNTLQAAGIEVMCTNIVDHIINRAGNDRCPLEKVCDSTENLDELFVIIDTFVKQKLNRQP